MDDSFTKNETVELKFVRVGKAQEKMAAIAEAKIKIPAKVLPESVAPATHLPEVLMEVVPTKVIFHKNYEHIYGKNKEQGADHAKKLERTAKAKIAVVRDVGDGTLENPLQNNNHKQWQTSLRPLLLLYHCH